ncbi:MAG: GTPase HflX [Thermogladius sp.]|nr:GTPase HflX [Thermogladius sp.]
MKPGRVVAFIPSKYRDFLDEELTLIKTVYGSVDEVHIVRKPNTRTYIQKDKLEYLSRNPPQKLVVMDILKPSQVSNILREVNTEVVDRVMLILEIFAQHAGSREALLQIELARIKHMLPLIKDFIRRSKLGELAGFLGPGRYGYEKYYTYLRGRESRIRREIEEIRRVREVRRERRMREGVPHVAIAGYTCAGKTTLFNALTGKNMPVGPEPFTTLSPKTAKMDINGVHVVVTDTVGFIRDLPPEITEAFYATLEEITASDLIVLVVDSSKPKPRVVNEIESSMRVFNEIGVHGKPLLIALNKIDLVDNSVVNELTNDIAMLIGDSSKIIPISAEKRINLDKLKNEVVRTIKGL